MLFGAALGALGGLTSSIGGFLGGRSRSKAKKKALEKQQAAIQKLKSIDIESYKKTAKQGDIAQLVNRYEAFRVADPELAKVRDASVQQMLNVMTGRQPELMADYMKTLTGQAIEAAKAPELPALQAQLLERAKQKLDLGATLPPEFQAELIRSGLEVGGASGVGASRRGPLGQLLGRAVGREQLALEAQREQQAQQLMQAAQQSQANRMSTLAGLIPVVQGVPQMQLAGQTFGLAQSLVPSQVGLTGQDIVNALEANRQFENQRIQALAGIQAQQALRKGEAQAGGWEAAGNLVNNLLSGASQGMQMFGGGGGGAPATPALPASASSVYGQTPEVSSSLLSALGLG